MAAEALFALAGTVVGAFTSAAVGWASSRSSERIAKADRDEHARTLAASGFALARAAVASLHPSLVEDAEWQSPGVHAKTLLDAHLPQLREALAQLDQVSALLAGEEVGSTSAAVARHLVVLTNSWPEAVGAGSMVGASIPPHEHDQMVQRWSTALDEVRRSREALLGYAGSSLMDEAGTKLGGLLGSLAEAIGKT
jgi:hypothetical protein